MNGTEQRTHTTAVRSIGRRLDDMELIINALAAKLVEERAHAAKTYATAKSTAEAFTALNQRQNALESRTRWARLKSFVMGA